MYVVVFFLFLWVLFQVVSVESRCIVENPDPRTLYILNTKNYDENIDLLIDELDTRFFNIPMEPLHKTQDGSNLYDITRYEVLKNCSPYLKDIMKDAHNLRYMVHLQVKDFYQNNYNAVSKRGYAWAGDLNCFSIARYSYRKIPCGPNKKVKLVSEAVTSIQSLYNLTLNLPKKDHLTHFNILVCSKNYKDLSSYTTFSYFDAASIKITFKLDNCNSKIRLSDDVIAVIAPNPNYIQVTYKPVVFYDETYVLPRTVELYDNSIMRVTSWKTLARAMLEIMKKKHWSRIAVLSDDSEASNDLEEELRTLFNNNDISYVVMAAKITKEGYDFSEEIIGTYLGRMDILIVAIPRYLGKNMTLPSLSREKTGDYVCHWQNDSLWALASLKHNDARIIVANVDERRVGTLARQAIDHELTHKHKLLWLAPGWSNDATNAALKMGNVLNFLPRKTDVDDLLLRIKRLIQSKRFDNHYDYLNTKVFARDISRYLQTDDIIDVFQTKSRDHTVNVASIVNNVIVKVAFYAPRDRQDDCLIKSQNYYKPCDDMLVMYLMLVILVFTVTVLGITYFFQTSHTPYKRM